jgi:hypothetical protein
MQNFSPSLSLEKIHKKEESENLHDNSCPLHPPSTILFTIFLKITYAVKKNYLIKKIWDVLKIKLRASCFPSKHSTT